MLWRNGKPYFQASHQTTMEPITSTPFSIYKQLPSCRVQSYLQCADDWLDRIVWQGWEVSYRCGIGKYYVVDKRVFCPMKWLIYVSIEVCFQVVHTTIFITKSIYCRSNKNNIYGKIMSKMLICHLYYHIHHCWYCYYYTLDCMLMIWWWWCWWCW